MSLQWNPGVFDRSGEILAGYKTRAAETSAAGKLALGQGMISGVTSLAGGALTAGTGQDFTGMITDGKGNNIPGLSEGMQRKAQEGQIASMALGKAEAIQAIGEQYGLDTSMLPSLLQETKDPYKLNAMLDVFGSHLDQQMKNSYLAQQQQNAMDLASYRSSLAQQARPAAPPSPSRVPWGVSIAPGIDMSR